MSLFGPPNVEKMKAKEDVKGLIKALGYKKDASVRKTAAVALVEIGEPAIEPLIAAIKEENEDVRQAAVEALVKIGEPAIEPLIAALKDYSVREGAAGVLGMMGEPALERAVERLIVGLEGEDDDVRGNAIEALTEIGEPAVESLIAALSDKSLNVRRIVVSMTLIKADTMEVIPHYQDLLAKLNDVLRDKGFTARGAVAGALGEIGDTRAIEPLIAALKDDDLLVRWAAAGALFVLRDARTLEPLATLKQDDLLIRGGFILVLIGDARTVKPLIAKLVDEDDDVRQTATEVLKKLGWKPA
ncbi:MAG: HEAT repeat domain-containing protein [Anaerolineales bacterium]|nr:HEAT repeat domain-containing protein [Anaerolineales bacterium]